MSRNLSLLIAGFNGLEYWLATFIPIPLIDRIGRRRIMLFSAIGQTVTMAVLAGCIAYPNSKPAGYVATVGLFVFNTFAAIGFDGIPFLLPVELTPLKTRGKSVAIATGCFWLCSTFHCNQILREQNTELHLDFFVVMISPVLIDKIKYGTYILWCGTNLVFIPLIYFLSMSLASSSLFI